MTGRGKVARYFRDWLDPLDPTCICRARACTSPRDFRTFQFAGTWKTVLYKGSD